MVAILYYADQFLWSNLWKRGIWNSWRHFRNVNDKLNSMYFFSSKFLSINHSRIILNRWYRFHNILYFISAKICTLVSIKLYLHQMGLNFCSLVVFMSCLGDDISSDTPHHVAIPAVPRHFRVSIDLRSIANLVISHPTSIFLRYSSPSPPHR